MNQKGFSKSNSSRNCYTNFNQTPHLNRVFANDLTNHIDHNNYNFFAAKKIDSNLPQARKILMTTLEKNLNTKVHYRIL